MGCGSAFSVSPAQRFLKVCRRAKRWHRTSDASSVGRRVHWRPEYIQARGHRASSHPQQSEGTLTSGTTGGSSSRGTSMGPCCCPYEYAWEGAELRTGCPLRTLLHQPFLTAASWSPGLLWGCPSQGQPAPCCSAGHQHVISSHILFPTAATLALCPGPYPPDQLPDSLILDSTPKAHSSSATSTHLSLRMSFFACCVARSDITRLAYTQLSEAVFIFSWGSLVQGALSYPAFPLAGVSSQMGIDTPSSHRVSLRRTEG